MDWRRTHDPARYLLFTYSLLYYRYRYLYIPPRQKQNCVATRTAGLDIQRLRGDASAFGRNVGLPDHPIGDTPRGFLKPGTGHPNDAQEPLPLLRCQVEAVAPQTRPKMRQR